MEFLAISCICPFECFQGHVPFSPKCVFPKNCKIVRILSWIFCTYLCNSPFFLSFLAWKTWVHVCKKLPKIIYFIENLSLGHINKFLPLYLLSYWGFSVIMRFYLLSYWGFGVIMRFYLLSYWDFSVIMRFYLLSYWGFSVIMRFYLLSYWGFSVIMKFYLLSYWGFSVIMRFYLLSYWGCII